MRHLSPNKQQTRVSSVIDKLYAKEKKHTYSKQYVREEAFLSTDNIFELDRAVGINHA